MTQRRVICPHCDREAKRVMGKVLYPRRVDLFGKNFYWCEPCDARVGCHPGTSVPLGSPANAATRKARVEAHAAFDPIWKSGRMGRQDAYAWLADQLGVAVQNCHIGMFDIETCGRVVAACSDDNQPPARANTEKCL